MYHEQLSRYSNEHTIPCPTPITRIIAGNNDCTGNRITMRKFQNFLMHITMLCPMSTLNTSIEGLSKFNPSKYNMIQQLQSSLVATGHSLSVKVYQNAVMFAAGNVNANIATETKREIKISCCSQNIFLIMLLPMGWQRLWQQLCSNLSFWKNIGCYKYKNR